MSSTVVPSGNTFSKSSWRWRLRDRLPGEPGRVGGQLALEPLLSAPSCLRIERVLGVVPAIGGGEDQACQPGGVRARPRWSAGWPGRSWLAPSGGLVLPEHSRQGGFPIPDAPVSRVVAIGQVEGHGDQDIQGSVRTGRGSSWLRASEAAARSDWASP